MMGDTRTLEGTAHAPPLRQPHVRQRLQAAVCCSPISASPTTMSRSIFVNGESRTAAFLAKNPNGRIPVLELEDGTCLAESNAILFYLAEGARFLPSERLARAFTLQWMFFEQYSHEPYIAVARHWIQHVGMTDEQRAQLAAKQEGGHVALAVMEGHLGGANWFGGEAMTIADIALFA